MKKIIFFTKNLEIGGLEKALLNLLNSFDFTQMAVTLVVEEQCGALMDSLNSAIRVKSYRLSTCRIPQLRKLFNFVHRMIWALCNYKKYDFSCSYCTYSVLGSRLAKYASSNSCLYVHSDYSQSMPSEEQYRSFFSALGVERFSHVVFVSNESRMAFLEVYPELAGSTCVINNLVDFNEIKKLAPENVQLSITGEPLFIFVGRLEEESKRLSRLIEAFSIAHSARPEIGLLIVGDGKDRKLCELLIKQYHLESVIELLGSRRNPYAFLRRADCLLLTSDYEGFPVVYYEALTLGMPIITTIRVSDEMLDIGDYATVVEKDAEAIAQAMVSFQGGSRTPVDLLQMNRKRMRRIHRLIEGRSP